MSESKVNIIIVISSRGRWGKGGDLATAFKKANLSMTEPDQSLSITLFTGVDEEHQDRFYIDGYGSLCYMNNVPRADIFQGKLRDMLPLLPHEAMMIAAEVADNNKRDRLAEKCEDLGYELQEKHWEELEKEEE